MPPARLPTDLTGVSWAAGGDAFMYSSPSTSMASSRRALMVSACVCGPTGEEERWLAALWVVCGCAFGWAAAHDQRAFVSQSIIRSSCSLFAATVAVLPFLISGSSPAQLACPVGSSCRHAVVLAGSNFDWRASRVSRRMRDTLRPARLAPTSDDWLVRTSRGHGRHWGQADEKTRAKFERCVDRGRGGREMAKVVRRP